MSNKTSKLDALALPFLIIGGVLIIFAFVFNFTVTPMALGDIEVPEPAMIGGKIVTTTLLLSQKIFFYHMPVAVISMVALAFTAAYGIMFLRTRNTKYDIRAQTATEMSLVFVSMTMVSGVAWTRHDWGAWWVWEPRLITYLILMLMVIAYFILRTAVSDPERRATYSSVFGIIVAVNAPISFMITRLVPSTHPVVFRSDSGLPPLMLIPLLLTILGFSLIAFALFRQRVRARQMEEQVESLKLRLDDLRG
ncbi:MAG: cytochrome c biogenesis protein [Coriobacteriia bacterium]|nr:cytochrome c biogenesis protein [Coriobacteriia bacterium]MCL2750360.1 cytochrome c biogenesis protein [Coriobacteriia bacterium]